ncbi:hypothetical protein ACRALDRAFT_1065689 [Sodiomyces alcalophilus JCM 7366]|uniref:uncharacterized protein n=1 Tax=Sodiomyces alcalophilus JCM 7366 TaxID=591952 RepID=UPI0039B4377A
MGATTFDISPEKRATQRQFFYRQIFVTPPPVSKRDVNLSGKTAIVTGSNVGLGLEAARQLLDLGCKVILAVRDEGKGEKARQTLALGRNLPSDSIEVWKLDLGSYDSIMSFTERTKSLKNLDIALLNGGLFKVHESFASTGYEEDIQVNYLSNILLAVSLLPIIKEKRVGSDPGRICLVSSDMAAWAKFEERTSTPLLPVYKQKAKNWDMGDRYATTKLLGQLFVTELSKHVPSSAVTVTLANPGFCASDLGRDTHGLFRCVHKIQSALIGRTCAVGARTLVHAVTTVGEPGHGQYIEDAKIQP